MLTFLHAKVLEPCSKRYLKPAKRRLLECGNCGTALLARMAFGGRGMPILGPGRLFRKTTSSPQATVPKPSAFEMFR